MIDFKAHLDLHAEPDVNPALLQERAPEGAACEPRARGLRKKAPTLDDDLAAHRNDRDDPVDVVSRPDRQLVELAQAIELQPIAPFMAGPCVERGSGGTDERARTNQPSLSLGIIRAASAFSPRMPRDEVHR